MPLGYEYKRYFIILQEEDKGYEMTAGKIPTGYVKIEIKKDKVRVGGFVQNMKSDTKSQYKLNLLAPNKKLVLDIGLFRMDGAGRGEFYAEFDSDNVSGSNLPIGEFTGALVVSGSGIPLVGYAGRESIPWRDWYGKEKEEVIESPTREKEDVTEEAPYIEERAEPEAVEEVRQVEIMEEETMREAVPEMEPIEEAREAEIVPEAEPVEELQEAETVPEIEPMEEVREAEPVPEIEPMEEAEEDIAEIEDARQLEEAEEDIAEIKDIRQLEEIPEPEAIRQEEPEELREAERQSFHGWDTSSIINDARDYERHKEEKKESPDKVQKRLHDVLKTMERFDGFHDEYGLRWYRIGRGLPLLNDVIIPVNGAMMPLSYPYIAETSGRNIENSVLGVEHRMGEIRYVYIGIAGIYNKACKSCYEYKGFTSYRRTKDNKRGYWVMCLDIKKGRVCRV